MDFSMGYWAMDDCTPRNTPVFWRGQFPKTFQKRPDRCLYRYTYLVFSFILHYVKSYSITTDIGIWYGIYLSQGPKN